MAIGTEHTFANYSVFDSDGDRISSTGEGGALLDVSNFGGAFHVGDMALVEFDETTDTRDMTYLGFVVARADDDELREYPVFQTAEGEYFVFAADGNTDLPLVSIPGSIVEQSFTVCFLEGTLIATPRGERPVESLAIGDLVSTADGRTVPVKWMGRQSVVPLFGPAERSAPVRIEAGALGVGVPHSDLFVSADHGIVLDGIVVHAGALVNGSSILREDPKSLGERFTYWHIETEGHEVVLANGALAETFIDSVSRRAFDNYAEFEALYGADVPEMVELPLPRATTSRQMPARIKGALRERAAVLASAKSEAA